MPLLAWKPALLQKDSVTSSIFLNEAFYISL